MQKFKSIQSYLCFLVALCTGSSCADEPAIRYWHFPCTGEHAITCIADTSTHIVALSGFDSDGLSKFYFSGGKELAVCAYEGEDEVMRKDLHLPQTGGSVMKLWNDSLYILHDQLQEVIGLKADGNGDITHYPLPGIERVFHAETYDNNGFIVQDAASFSEEMPEFSLQYYHFPNSLVRQSAGFTNTTTGDAVEKQKRDSLLNLPTIEEVPYGQYTVPLPGTYLGQYGSSLIYAWMEGDMKEDAIISVYSLEGACIQRISVPDTNGAPVFSDDGTYAEGESYLSNRAILRGEKVYLICYDLSTLQLQVAEVNLKAILKTRKNE